MGVILAKVLSFLASSVPVNCFAHHPSPVPFPSCTGRDCIVASSEDSFLQLDPQDPGSGSREDMDTEPKAPANLLDTDEETQSDQAKLGPMQARKGL